MLNAHSVLSAFKRDATSDQLNCEGAVDTRSLVAKFSSGNVSLQLGRYATEKDIDARREKVCNYNYRGAWKTSKKKK